MKRSKPTHSKKVMRVVVGSMTGAGSSACKYPYTVYLSFPCW